MEASIYTRPDKPMFIPVTRWDERRPQNEIKPLTVPEPALVLHVSSQCFVTPPEVAERMVDYANLEPGQLVYDPEAGTGNLLQAVLTHGPVVTLMGNELQQSLVEYMRKRFAGQNITLTQGDFLEQSGLCVDRIIMNPPYSKRQAYYHVAHARKCLTDNVVIIACVPVTFQVDGMYEIERLPPGAFAGTDVVTKIIELTN